MKLRVEVTAEDIAKGERGMGCNCAIAHALRRAGYPSPFVQPWGAPKRGPFIRLDVDDDSLIDLPSGAALLARLWDEGDKIAPFAFEIEVPDTAVSE